MPTLLGAVADEDVAVGVVNESPSGTAQWFYHPTDGPRDNPTHMSDVLTQWLEDEYAVRGPHGETRAADFGLKFLD